MRTTQFQLAALSRMLLCVTYRYRIGFVVPASIKSHVFILSLSIVTDLCYVSAVGTFILGAIRIGKQKRLMLWRQEQRNKKIIDMFYCKKNSTSYEQIRYGKLREQNRLTYHRTTRTKLSDILPYHKNYNVWHITVPQELNCLTYYRTTRTIPSDISPYHKN